MSNEAVCRVCGRKQSEASWRGFSGDRRGERTHWFCYQNGEEHEFDPVQPEPSMNDRVQEARKAAAYEAWQGGGEPIANDPYVLVAQFKSTFLDGFRTGQREERDRVAALVREAKAYISDKFGGGQWCYECTRAIVPWHTGPHAANCRVARLAAALRDAKEGRDG